MIPLYSRIESLIRSKILSGQYEPGEKIPTEEEFVKHFGVSKATIRNAISGLERDGLVTRKQGKGTFVSEAIPVSKQFIVSSAIEAIVADASRYKVTAFDIKQVQVRETRVAKDVRRFYTLSNDDEVAWLRRVRLLKSVPILFLENFIPLDLAHYFSKKELSEKPLLKIIKEKTDFTIGRGEMYIEANPAEPDIAELLHLHTFDPLINMQAYYWSSLGQPLSVSNCYMRVDYFKYKADIDPKGFENI